MLMYLLLAEVAEEMVLHQPQSTTIINLVEAGVVVTPKLNELILRNKHNIKQL